MKNFNQALSYAFLLLRYRPRAQEEIFKRLRKKDFSAGVSKRVVNYLKKSNYLNDRDFVENYLEVSRQKGWGPLRVSLDLKKLGISDKLRKKANQKRKKESQELIKELLEKKIYSLEKIRPELTEKKIKEKAVRFLVNKGFFYKDIFNNLGKYFEKNES